MMRQRAKPRSIGDLSANNPLKTLKSTYRIRKNGGTFRNSVPVEPLDFRLLNIKVKTRSPI
jgi:hypothetical protein